MVNSIKPPQGFSPPLAFVASLSLLLFLLRHVSIRLIPSDRENIKEASMVKTLKARTRIFSSSVVESIWAIGVGSL